MNINMHEYNRTILQTSGNQNGDPSKPVIANGQTYFAIQTRRQELADNKAFQRLKEDEKRLFLRNEMKEHNKKPAKAAQHAGVESNLMGSTELAVNLFRATQTEEKLRRENTQGKTKANKTHFEVGKKVRQTIEELGGTMPENLPTPDDDLKKIGKAGAETTERKPRMSTNLHLYFLKPQKEILFSCGSCFSWPKNNSYFIYHHLELGETPWLKEVQR